MKILPSLILTALLLMPAFTSTARADDGLSLPPDGQTVIGFSATEMRKVPQDTIISSLRIEEEGATPAAVQDKINKAMAKALDLAKKDAALKVSTGGYNVYKYDEPQRPKQAQAQDAKSVWRGSQTIDIESKDSTKVLDVTGKIQEMGFAMNGLSYTLSTEVVEKTRDELMIAALKKLQDKAAIVAKTLGKAKYDLIEVNVDGGAPIMPVFRQSMMAKGMAMDSAMAAPVAEAGETDVSLTVSARALIRE